MFSLKPDPEIRVQTIQIASEGRKMSMLVLSPKTKTIHATGILWIHGGGYIYGMKEMVNMSRAVDLVKQYGADTGWRFCRRTRPRWMIVMRR